MNQIAINSYAGTSRKPIAGIAVLAFLWSVLYFLNERIWDWLIFDFLGWSSTDGFARAIHFWILDFSKISLLLTGISFSITFLQSFISVEKSQRFLNGKRQGFGYAIAATLGTVTPFCSCSSVPIFIGFVSSRIPIGITMTFLIASPLVSELAFFMLFALFGWKLALLYAVSGITISILAGLTLAAIKAERWLVPGTVVERLNRAGSLLVRKPTLQERFENSRSEARNIYKKLWPYLVAGLTLGAALHGWMPTELINNWLGDQNPFSVVIAVAIGVPLYANASGVMPIVEVLWDKGLPIGTLLAFMMSVIALSLPEMVLLKRVMQPKLLAVFVSVVAFGIILVGYMFNLVS